MSGCEEKQPQAVKPEEMEVSINIRDFGIVPSSEGTIEDNRWTRFMSGQSGVRIRWVPIPYPYAQARQKLNTLVAAGEAPDLLVFSDRNVIGSYVVNGAVQPIDDYIDKYSTVYKTYLQNHPELDKWVRFDDGKMYAVATLRPTWGQLVHGGYIRQDWLDALGLRMPETVEELFAAAKAFKDNDPDGNGKSDTYGIVFDSEFSAGNLIEIMYAADGNKWFMENGQAVYGPLTDRYKDAIAAVKRLYDEKLIDKDYLTDKNAERQKQLWVSGKAGIFLGNFNNFNAWFPDLKKNDPQAKLIPLPAVSTPYGRNGYNQAAGLAAELIAFNKQMKNPRAAVQFIDWMLGQGWRSLVNGTEEGADVTAGGAPYDGDPPKGKSAAYGASYAFLRDDRSAFAEAAAPPGADPVTAELSSLRLRAAETFLSVPYRRDFPVMPFSPELDQTVTAFNAFVTQTLNKAVISGPDYTPDMAAADLKKEWSRLGGDKLARFVTDWHRSKTDMDRKP